MATPQNLLAQEDDPGVLDVTDTRIPAEVRGHFADYAKQVTSVVPVIGVSREEWWLFDDDGALVDVLLRGTAAADAAADKH